MSKEYIEKVLKRYSKDGTYEFKEISFVYCELKKYNQTFIEQIEKAQTSEQLLAI